MNLLSITERDLALYFAGEAEASAELVSKAYNELQLALSNYQSAARSASSLVPSGKAHLMSQRAGFLKRKLNNVETASLATKARRLVEFIQENPDL